MDFNLKHFEAGSQFDKYDIRDMPKYYRVMVEELIAILLSTPDRVFSVAEGEKIGTTFLLEQVVHNAPIFAERLGVDLRCYVADSSCMRDEIKETYLRAKRVVADEKKKKNIDGKKTQMLVFAKSPVDARIIKEVDPKAFVVLDCNGKSTAELNESSCFESGNWKESIFMIEANLMPPVRDAIKAILDTKAKEIEEDLGFKLKASDLRWLFIEASPETDRPDTSNKEEVKEWAKETYIDLPMGCWCDALYGALREMKVGGEKLTKKNWRNRMIRELEDGGALYRYYLSFSEGEDFLKELFGSEFADDEDGPMFNKSATGATSGVPSELRFEYSDIRTLESRLKEKIVGQDRVIKEIAGAFFRGKAGLGSPEKPIHSFFLLGPTGVGKTQTCIEVAKSLGKEEMELLRIDMSEYQSEADVSKLLGAPPGYVGYTPEGGTLVKTVRENPSTVVLFDEVEKAHPKVWDTLLQILDDGRLSSPVGEVIDFSNTVIFFTSNIGMNEATKRRSGFAVSGKGSGIESVTNRNSAETKKIIKAELRKNFRPEFLNRIDDILVFDHLSEESASKIARMEINKISARLAAKSNGNVLKRVPKAVIDYIVEKSEVATYGARDIQSIINKEVSTRLGEIIVSQQEGDKPLTIEFKALKGGLKAVVKE